MDSPVGIDSPAQIIVQPQPIEPSPLPKMIAVAAIAIGIQFGWALQLSLLTPYIQLLGVPHRLASLIWLCGPISGMLVQPIVGYYSDRCTSPLGRRRPFIFAGTIAVAIGVLLISYAADLGHVFGDDISKKTHPRAILIYVFGFWILDVANNALQGPCRTFLGDLSAGDHSRIRIGNTLFCLFMGIGNVLGYAAGADSGFHHLFPFTETEACDQFCANLKSCYFISIMLLIGLASFALYYVPDPPLVPGNGDESHGTFSCFVELFSTLKNLEKRMWILMLVTACNWLAWFPYILYNTDWMGLEVYAGQASIEAYDAGVRAGALGLMLNSVVLFFTSLAVERLGRCVGGPTRLWGIVNVILAVCLTMTVPSTKVAQHQHQHHASGGAATVGKPSPGVTASALIFFSILGIPLAVTYSIPFALASIYSITAGAGQGVYLGILNMAIVIPQMIVAGSAGSWDALFGDSNLPAFVVGAIMAAVSAILAMVLLSSPTPAHMPH